MNSNTVLKEKTFQAFTLYKSDAILYKYQEILTSLKFTIYLN